MRFITGVFLLAIFILGLARLLFEQGPSGPIELQAAQDLAQCLGVGREIPTNSAVTVVPLIDDSKPTSAEASQQAGAPAIRTVDNVCKQEPNGRPDRLCFLPTTAVQVDLEDTAGRQAIESGASFKLDKEKYATIVEGRGSFEFGLASGQVMVQTGDNVKLLLTAKKNIRLSPAVKTSYRLLLPGGTTVTSEMEGGKHVGRVAAGTAGELELGLGQSLVTLQPLPTAPWLQRTLPTLTPARSLGELGVSELTIQARQPGMAFGDPGSALVSCAHSDLSVNWTPIGVVETKAQITGAATVRLAMPAGIVPALAWGLSNVKVAVASRDGQYRAYGGFATIAKGTAAIAAVLITALLFLWASGLATQAAGGSSPPKFGQAEWFAGLFVGTDNEPSLSLFQIFFWTVLTVWGLIYVFAVSGSLLSVTGSMMTLLGIAGTGSVLARWIAASSAERKPASPAPASRKFEFWQILSTDGNFDLLKLQLFVFTLTIGIYVVWRIADTATFPDIDANTLMLLGVSQGIYVGSKAATASALSKAQQLKLDLAVRKEARASIDLPKVKADQAALEAKKKAGTATQEELTLYDKLTSTIKEAEDLDKLILDLDAKLKQAVKDLGLTP